MKTVHEFFTNKRMEDSRFEYSWFYSWMVVYFAGVVARRCNEPVEVVDPLSEWMSEGDREASPSGGRQALCRLPEGRVEVGLFEALLSESFG